jgi:cell division protein FtsB
MKSRLVKWLRNKYVLATLIFLFVISLVNDIDLFFIIERRMHLARLENEYRELVEDNKRIRHELHELTSSNANLEKYAREKFYMKRDNEVVYIFRESVD